MGGRGFAAADTDSDTDADADARAKDGDRFTVEVNEAEGPGYLVVTLAEVEGGPAGLQLYVDGDYAWWRGKDLGGHDLAAWVADAFEPNDVQVQAWGVQAYVGEGALRCAPYWGGACMQTFE